jgi:hypothetical protein
MQALFLSGSGIFSRAPESIAAARPFNWIARRKASHHLGVSSGRVGR